MSSPKLIIQDDKKKSVPINISKSVPLDNDLLPLDKSPPKVLQTSLYKTERCRSWITTGMCKYGNKCQFAHGNDELRPVLRHPKYKTQICKTFSRDGFCPYGSRCRFIHPGEITKSSSSNDFLEYEGNSLPNESSILGFSPSPISSSFLGERSTPENNSNGLKNNFLNQQNGKSSLFSSSLPNYSNFPENFLNMNKNNPFNKNLNTSNPSLNISPTKKNLSKEFDSPQDDFYDPFQMNEKNRKNDSLYSKSLFPGSPGSSQFQFSPSPSGGVFNLSNPNITSPPTQNNIFSFDVEEDPTFLKKRTKSIPGELYDTNSLSNSPKNQFPFGISKSKPTNIPINNNNNNNNNNNQESPNNDSKSRLPFFTSLAN